MALKVLLVEDHAPTRAEMRSLIEHEADMAVVAEAGSGEEALQSVAQAAPAVVVMDILLPGINGIEATRAVRDARPGIQVLALSNHSSRGMVQSLLDAGGLGYVRKDHAFEELVAGIREVAAGRMFLGRDVPRS